MALEIILIIMKNKDTVRLMPMMDGAWAESNPLKMQVITGKKEIWESEIEDQKNG